MKFRLFRRRLTISSPRMAVRSALPWPLRWIAGALMLGFSASIALWAFEFGKGIAGLDTNAKQELSLPALGPRQGAVGGQYFGQLVDGRKGGARKNAEPDQAAGA